jgi:hypothetical protein
MVAESVPLGGAARAVRQAWSDQPGNRTRRSDPICAFALGRADALIADGRIGGASWRDRKPIPNFGGDAMIGGADSSAPVHAILAGSADVKGEAALTVKIEAPELIKAFRDAQRAISLVGRLNSNGPGSTGRSSPDAQAPGGTSLTRFVSRLATRLRTRLGGAGRRSLFFTFPLSQSL